jgi:predicted amidohydrolase
MNPSNTTCSFKVGVIQHAPVFLNIEESLEKACALIEQAADQGANLIAFPETWLPGYPVWLDFSPEAALWDYPPAKALYRLLVENSVTIPGKHLEKLLAIARKTGTYVIMGVHEHLGGTLYNTMIYIGRDGKRFQLHRKLLPTYTERMIWGRGDGSTLSVFNTEYGNLGGLICWEHWMPLARAAMHAQYETLHIAQWPAVKELHQLASRHYAFEGQCFVIAAGCVLSRGEVIEGFHSLGRSGNEAVELLEAIPGGEKDFILRGGSAVIAPNSDYLKGPVFDEPCVLYAEIQPARITEGRLFLDTHGHYSRPDVFHLEVNDQPQSNVTFKSRSE